MKVSKVRHLDVLEVHWLDSSAHAGWSSSLDLSDQTVAVISVGFLVHESNQIVTLGLSYDPETDEWNPLITIPKVSIKKRKLLCKIKTKLT